MTCSPATKKGKIKANIPYIDSCLLGCRSLPFLRSFLLPPPRRRTNTWAATNSKTMVDFYQTIWTLNQEDSHLCTHYHENFKSYTLHNTGYEQIFLFCRAIPPLLRMAWLKTRTLLLPFHLDFGDCKPELIFTYF